MNLPLFERLGVLEKVAAMGVFKPGADFEADNERGYNTFAFRRAIGNSPPHAYQEWQQNSDKMLFDTRAPRAHRMTREGHEWLRSSKWTRAAATSEVRTDDGQSYRITAQYVVDATGRDTFLSSKKRLRRKNGEHQSAAIFWPLSRCRVPSRRASPISASIAEHGWMWMIPLPDGVMSIGAVCRPAYLKQRKGKTVDF